MDGQIDGWMSGRTDGRVVYPSIFTQLAIGFTEHKKLFQLGNWALPD